MIEVNSTVRLEARWDEPADLVGAIVFCHPHPQHGGTMRAPLMHKVTKVLVSRGVAVLRFNFRGVGESSGDWDNGVGEVDDVAAAMAAAQDRHGEGVALAGWSFGAVTALRWQARERATMTYVGIAPPVSSGLTPVLPQPEELASARRTFVLGDRDQFVTTAELEAYASSIDATVEVLQGSDHFFYFREERVGTIVAEAVLNDAA